MNIGLRQYMENLTPKHRVFISYHHKNDQYYKEALLRLNEQYSIFVDTSVDTGEIDEDLPDETIREKIRDEYLRNSTVTIVLVGTETKNRKHVDWEIYSSMFDGPINKKSGILVVTLPSTGCTYYTAAHESEKPIVYPEQKDWMSISSRAEYEERYPYLPARIIDNLLKKEAKVSVTNWSRIENNPVALAHMIETAHADKLKCEYDLSRVMRRADS